MHNVRKIRRTAAYSAVVAALMIGGHSLMAVAEPGDNKPPPPPPPNVDRAMDDLDLTDAQRSAVEPMIKDFHQKQRQLHDELFKQLKAVLTPEQYEKLQSATRRPPPPPREDRPDGDKPDAPPPPATQPQAAMPADGARVPVQFTDGHDTDPRDHGRPVILVASGLGVPADVFRDAFTRVHPAGAGESPGEQQVRDNKRALMQTLSPYGVTDDRLNAVSNYYRYNRSARQMWRNTPATAYATIENGKVTSITITNPGAGYTTPPTLAVGGINAKATALLSFGTDLMTNGSVKSISLAAPE